MSEPDFSDRGPKAWVEDGVLVLYQRPYTYFEGNRNIVQESFIMITNLTSDRKSYRGWPLKPNEVYFSKSSEAIHAVMSENSSRRIRPVTPTSNLPDGKSPTATRDRVSKGRYIDLEVKR